VFFDTPTGATIVCTFGAVLVVMAGVKAVFFRVRQEEPQPAEVAVR
jgi:hypothetical protein